MEWKNLANQPGAKQNKTIIDTTVLITALTSYATATKQSVALWDGRNGIFGHNVHNSWRNPRQASPMLEWC